MTRLVHVSVPASSANLGPGFDGLGLALGLHLDVTVEETAGHGVEVVPRGLGAAELPRDERNAVCRALLEALEQAGHRPGWLRLTCDNAIPLTCGLGSSAAAYLAGTAAGMLLGGQPLDRQVLIERGAAHDGHPDNIVPSVVGGFAVAVIGTRCVHYVRLVPPAHLRPVVVIPDFRLPTRQARDVLPRQVAFGDAVANIGRAGLLTAALASGRLEGLAEAMVDRLHQPYRVPLVPGLEAVCQAAVAAGAAGAALSGAGPGVLALTVGDPAAVGAAMVAAWQSHGIAAQAHLLAVDLRGLDARIAREGEAEA